MFYLTKNTVCMFQASCELEIRERNGKIIRVSTGCQEKLACENNKAQNFQGNLTLMLKKDTVRIN